MHSYNSLIFALDPRAANSLIFASISNLAMVIVRGLRCLSCEDTRVSDHVKAEEADESDGICACENFQRRE